MEPKESKFDLWEGVVLKKATDDFPVGTKGFVTYPGVGTGHEGKARLRNGCVNVQIDGGRQSYPIPEDNLDSVSSH